MGRCCARTGAVASGARRRIARKGRMSRGEGRGEARGGGSPWGCPMGCPWYWVGIRLSRCTKVEAVEQESKCPMRLAAEGDLGAKHHERPLAYLCLGDRDALVECLFAPRPTAPQRMGRTVPGHLVHGGAVRVGGDAERRALIVEHGDTIRDAVGQRLGAVHLRHEHGTWN